MVNMPILLAKRPGETPLACLDRYRRDHPEIGPARMTYAGRLDPMAEGLLLALAGPACKEKEGYAALPKTYEFEVLFGCATDTYDVLGLVTDVAEVFVPDQASVYGVAANLVGTHDESYPPFSSKPARSHAASGPARPLFAWAKEGRLGEVAIPMHTVEVLRLSFEGMSAVSGMSLYALVRDRVAVVEGDFRQEDVLRSWAAVLSVREDVLFPILRFSADVASGTYIRSLAVRLGREFGAPALAFSIRRTAIGLYSLTHAV